MWQPHSLKSRWASPAQDETCTRTGQGNVSAPVSACRKGRTGPAQRASGEQGAKIFSALLRPEHVSPLKLFMSPVLVARDRKTKLNRLMEKAEFSSSYNRKAQDLASGIAGSRGSAPHHGDCDHAQLAGQVPRETRFARDTTPGSSAQSGDEVGGNRKDVSWIIAVGHWTIPPRNTHPELSATPRGE